MKFNLYSKVALRDDLPKHGLKKGDVAVIVESHPEVHGERGYTLEVFNAIGETIAVPTVKESQIEELTSEEVLQVRRLNLGRVAEPQSEIYKPRS